MEYPIVCFLVGNIVFSKSNKYYLPECSFGSAMQ